MVMYFHLKNHFERKRKCPHVNFRKRDSQSHNRITTVCGMVQINCTHDPNLHCYRRCSIRVVLARQTCISRMTRVEWNDETNLCSYCCPNLGVFGAADIV